MGRPKRKGKQVDYTEYEEVDDKEKSKSKKRKLDELDGDYTVPGTRRQKYLGATPTFDSGTGKELLRRWAKKSKARYGGSFITDPTPKQLRDSGKWEVSVRKKSTFDPKTKKKAPREWVDLSETYPSRNSGKPIRSINMGHRVGAATFWEKGSGSTITWKSTQRPEKEDHYETLWGKYRKPGFKFGEKSGYGRGFMTDPNNYRFEWGPLNSSRQSSGDRFTMTPRKKRRKNNE